MGMLIHVLRSTLGDCTAGGISSTHKSLVVVNCEGPFKPGEDTPAVLLESHYPGCLRIVEAELLNGMWVRRRGHAMHGGNYAATSDGRFIDLCQKLLRHTFYGAVAVHDRYES